MILRVGWNAQAVYEFGQHTVIGKRCGLTDDEIVALTKSPHDHDWSSDDRALIALADDLHADDCVSDGTWLALADRWSEAELVELLIVAGFYRLVSGFLNSAGVQLDDGIPGFPDLSACYTGGLTPGVTAAVRREPYSTVRGVRSGCRTGRAGSTGGSTPPASGR